MDRGSNPGGLTAPDADAPSVDSASVTCDQAIYTCIKSPTGQGYRIISASPGLEPSERGEILRRTPAVNGLCIDDADAIGVSFFPLSSGRHAILHTCHAGMEPTGRGGRRT